jgi:cytochrome P450
MQTSHTTSFLLYFLARNPEKQEKLRQEILSVVGSKGTTVITPGALNELHYLKACIKESLRLVICLFSLNFEMEISHLGWCLD